MNGRYRHKTWEQTRKRRVFSDDSYGSGKFTFFMELEGVLAEIMEESPSGQEMEET